jgi:uncharacterized transporter YbjL
MAWLFELHKTQPIAFAVGMLAFVCLLGMALGSVKFRGIGLGTSGVLFAGILVGHFGQDVDHHTLVVTNQNLNGLRLDAVPGRVESRVTVSRVRHGDETHAATNATVIHRGDLPGRHRHARRARSI